MAEAAAGSASTSYGEGVKWLVGLSAAAIGGAFLHFDEVRQLPFYVRILAATALILFSVSIWAGVWYLLWLNTLAVRRERNRELEALKSSARLAARNGIDKEIEHNKEKIEQGEKTMPFWHRRYTKSFGGALLLAALLLAIAVILPANEKVGPQAPVSVAIASHDPAHSEGTTNHFEIRLSAVHGKRGNLTHTFLLNEQTGSIWQMICQPDGMVAFRRTRRLDASGSPER